MPKWVYPLAFLFVLFLIYNDPSGSGDTAGNFAGFLGELLGAVSEFLSGLFEGGGETITDSSGASSGSGATSTTVAATESGTSVADSFTHAHDGFPTHSHPAVGE